MSMEDTKLQLIPDIPTLRFAGDTSPWQIGLQYTAYTEIISKQSLGVCTVHAEDSESMTIRDQANANIIAMAPRLLANILKQAAHDAVTDEIDFYLQEERTAIIKELFNAGALING